MMSKVFQESTDSINAGAFRQLSSFLYDNFGLKVPLAKKILVEGRIRKRIRVLGMTSFEEYLNYVFNSNGTNNEIIQMVNVITTNMTSFFREPDHFEILQKSLQKHFFETSRECLVWSAGCSSGQEPYSLSIVLQLFKEQCNQFKSKIFATDISTAMLDKAISATYSEDDVKNIPLHIKKKYLLRSKNEDLKQVRIIPALREMVHFSRLNLMEDWKGIPLKIDYIFCRNVLIYFDRTTQLAVVNRFFRHLNPGGYLFLGHSETICNSDINMKAIAPAVYMKL